MGRPTSSPLNYDLRIRLDEDTYKRLEKFCNLKGQGKATIVRLILKDYLKDK